MIYLKTNNRWEKTNDLFEKIVCYINVWFVSYWPTLKFSSAQMTKNMWDLRSSKLHEYKLYNRHILVNHDAEFLCGSFYITEQSIITPLMISHPSLSPVVTLRYRRTSLLRLVAFCDWSRGSCLLRGSSMPAAYWLSGCWRTVLTPPYRFVVFSTRSIADWLKPPDTWFLLDFIKPEFLLLRVSVALALCMCVWVYSFFSPFS